MNKNFTKNDIVLDVYEKTEFPQKFVKETVQLVLESISEALASGRNVELRNFGIFEVRMHKERMAHNPRKVNEKVFVPAHSIIKFKTGKELKDKLKKLDDQNLNHNSKL